MTQRVVYTPEAEQDITDAYNWYEAREPGLGEDFLRCVEACVLTIQRHPRLYPVAVDEFRRALVRRFPFEAFMNPPEITSPFILSFIARKTREIGVRELDRPCEDAPNPWQRTSAPLQSIRRKLTRNQDLS